MREGEWGWIGYDWDWGGGWGGSGGNEGYGMGIEDGESDWCEGEGWVEGMGLRKRCDFESGRYCEGEGRKEWDY